MRPNVHYHARSPQSLVSILMQTNPAHIYPSYFSKIHSNIILLSTPRCSKLSLPFRIPDQTFVRISHISYACYMSHISHLKFKPFHATTEINRHESEIFGLIGFVTWYCQSKGTPHSAFRQFMP